MIKMVSSLVLLICGFLSLYAQPIPSYYERALYLNAPAGAHQNGLLGFVNPAMPQMLDRFESKFLWTTEGRDAWSLDDWGWFTGIKGLSFGIARWNFNAGSVTDYKISFAGGNKGLAFGIGYGWSSGDFDAFGRERILSPGLLFRPNRYFSLGAVGNFSLQSNAREGIMDLAIRPLGNSRLTLFGDFAIQKQDRMEDIPWSAGAVLEIVPGIHLAGRYFDNEALTLGINLSFGYSAVNGQSYFSNQGERLFTTYGVRVGSFTPNPVTSLWQKTLPMSASI